jgi:hypothetical protein
VIIRRVAFMTYDPYNEKTVIRDTLEELKNNFDFSWNFESAELKKDGIYLVNHKGLKFKISMEYLGFEKR